MLKIKDSVELKELEKFGFKYVEGKGEIIWLQLNNCLQNGLTF